MGNDARRFALAAALCAAALLPAPGDAAVHVLQLYSSPDGEYQAILLEDDEGDGVDRFRGLTLVAHDTRGHARPYTLTRDRVTEDAIDVGGRRRFLVATRSLARWMRAQAELPEAFVETAGGIVEIFGGSSVHYGPLDRDGAVAFERGTGRPFASNLELALHPRALADDAALASGDFFAHPLPAPVVREYRDVYRDRFVLAVSQREKADLDAGRHRGWERTGRYFRALDPRHSAGVVTVPVCRYYLPPPHGDAHFFSAFAEECDAIARTLPGAVLESGAAFHVALPERTTGLCMPDISIDAIDRPLATMPLYRSVDGRAGTGHRYTTRVSEHRDMLAQGWIPEGYGPLGTAMCVDDFDMGMIRIPKQKPRLAPPTQ